MIGRFLVIAGGVAAGAVAAAAVWTRRKAELDDQARKAGAEMPVIPGAADDRERGLTPLPPQADPPAPSTVPSDPPEETDTSTGLDAPRVADELQSLKGIGAVSERRLAEQGVTTFAQIAAWTDDDLEATAAAIKVSPERIRREDWVGQAAAAVEGTS